MKRVALLIVLVMILNTLCACRQLIMDHAATSGDEWYYVDRSLTDAELEYMNRTQATEEVEATTEKTEATTEPTVGMQGRYTLEQCKESPGIYVKYADGSFDIYQGGYVMNRSRSVFTYGNDYEEYEDLVISASAVERNLELLPKGQLVLFWPYDYIVWEGLYRVEESGYTLFRINEDGKLEGLFASRGNTLRGMDLWRQGNWKGSYKYTTINGVPKESSEEFPTGTSGYYLSFPANQTYTIGAVEGTTLIEKEFKSNYMYFLHDSKESDYTLNPTTDGYAVFDFSDTAPGEYVFRISYWDKENKTRRAVSTYILLE